MVGIAVIALSSYVLHTSVEYDKIILNGTLMLPMWTLIGGVFLTILSFFGACGVLRRSTCMLRCYGSLVLVILIMELVCGILLIVYRDEAADLTKDKMIKVFEQYGGQDEALTNSINVAQHDLECCGVSNYEDWFYILNSNDVTPGCCKDTSDMETCYQSINALSPDEIEETLYTKGCYKALMDDLADEILALGILCLVLVAVQVMAEWWQGR
ncbi:Tetraspanin/Peripherin [Trinorchestia longiramus]|nr:Tetraspanin/Peripherin [Trinorchestia longiramus]